jgi:hypothetical protein
MVENVLLLTAGGELVYNVQSAVTAAEPETTGIPKCKKGSSIAAVGDIQNHNVERCGWPLSINKERLNDNFHSIMRHECKSMIGNAVRFCSSALICNRGLWKVLHSEEVHKYINRA